MENKVYIIVSWNNDYGALNYEDKYNWLSLDELNKLYNEEEDDFIFRVVEGIEPSEETEKFRELIITEELIDYDSSKNTNIFLINKKTR